MYPIKTRAGSRNSGWLRLPIFCYYPRLLMINVNKKKSQVVKNGPRFCRDPPGGKIEPRRKNTKTQK